MGEEKGPEFYTGLGYLKNGGFEHNKKLYDTALSLLPPYKEYSKIIELACGVGYFASLIRKHEYIGIDFSKKVLDAAQTINPDKKFIHGNLLDTEIHKLYDNKSVYVCLEALEHIRFDHKILTKIPSNSPLIFSVPNRDFTSHVRFFTDKEEIIKRYESILDFKDCIWKEIITNPKKSAKVFMCRARRK